MARRVRFQWVWLMAIWVAAPAAFAATANDGDGPAGRFIEAEKQRLNHEARRLNARWTAEVYAALRARGDADSLALALMLGAQAIDQA